MGERYSLKSAMSHIDDRQLGHVVTNAYFQLGGRGREGRLQVEKVEGAQNGGMRERRGESQG